MNGMPIGAQAIAYSGLRALPSEWTGPRPGGVRGSETERTQAETRTKRATRP